MKPLLDELERLSKALEDSDKDLKPTPIPTPVRNPIEDFLKMNGLKN